MGPPCTGSGGKELSVRQRAIEIRAESFTYRVQGMGLADANSLGEKKRRKVCKEKGGKRRG